MDITVSCTLDHPLNLQPIEVYSHQCPRSPTLLALGVCVLWRFLALNTKDLYGEAIRFAFSEFVEQHVTRIKNLIHLFPEDETVKDKETGKVSNFWTGHKKFPHVPQFDGDSLGGDLVIDYLYAQSQLWAFAFDVPADQQPKNRQQFVEKAKSLKLALPEWKEPVGLKIKVDEDEVFYAAHFSVDCGSRNVSGTVIDAPFLKVFLV